MTDQPISPLLTEAKLGRYTLPHRFVMAPLTRLRATNPEDAVGALHATYYAQRATAALIISEATHISPQGKGYPGAPGIYSEAQIAGWKQVTDAVHAAGSLIFAQLWHVGRIAHSSVQPGGALPVAPSAIRPEGQARTYDGKRDFETPRALETEELPGIVEQYRHAARSALKAGFDGVEIHAANGYLLDQFLKDGTNKRTDAYGGSVENRARLTLEVVDAVIAVWGADRVGIRLSPSGKMHMAVDGDPERNFIYVARELGKRGLAYLHVVEPSNPYGDPFDRDVDPQVIRRAFGGTYIANGGYGLDKARAEATITSGEAEFIAFGRPYIANPDLPRRLTEGLPLAETDQDTVYSDGPEGYSDYPIYEESRLAETG
ncbi:MAG: alkene reductase [Alphaproteobacteria bacterium]|nr:alkene reductase [Alphaproteobacteria bacterium]